MLFNTLAYAKFFALVAIASVALARFRVLHLLFLLGASFAFYAGWDWRFLPLLVGSASVDFFLARVLEREPRPGVRRAWLAVTVAVNLGVLGFFKYADFGISTASALLRAVGVDASPHLLGVTLPVGISFFTFESMSYVIDVYRRQIPAHPSYLRYLLFVAFFPHMVAGPIVRPRDMLPQLARRPEVTDAMVARGLFLVATGLLKKMVVADYLAGNLVDRVFDRPFEYSSVEVGAAIYGFAAQIYCDFSGYTDIAIGSALLLGYRFPENFDRPYRSASCRELWQRWHISLSSWLRDYLYVPLGGSRDGLLHTCRNVMITMLLGGLWHGARWTFVVWGALHGLGLVVERVATALRAPRAAPRSALVQVLAVAATFHFTCLAWVFFRAETFGKAVAVLRQLGEGSTSTANLPAAIALAIVAGIAPHWLPARWYDRAIDLCTRMPAPARALALFAVAVVLREAESAKPVPFLYFQF